jgi:flagellum-specific peptidoglycan hydrolase FlgJ
MDKNDFLLQMKQAAMNIGASWPGYWAAEAALESGFGSSRLYREANNPFGRKQSVLTNVYDTLDLPTKEYSNGEWVTVMAHWIKYPDLDSAFRDRLALLNRLSGQYPHYANALKAADGETFIREVSKTWSTDPERGQKVLDIYDAHREVLA